MQKIKKVIKQVWVELTWWAVNLIITLSKPKTIDSSAVLLVPAANLDGGFGEDIMVTSFIENFAKGKKVTIFTWSEIKRPDCLSVFNNISYVGGFTDRLNFIKALNLIKEHSLVYVIGADIMDGTYGPSLVINRLRLLEIANKLGLQTQISGFSISNKIVPSVKSKLISISKFMSIKARDIDSYNRLASYIDKEKLILTNDIAFICPDIPQVYEGQEYENYCDWVNKVRAGGASIVGVCPNAIQAQKYGLVKYVNELKELLNQFISERNYAFVFLYHDIRPLCGNDTDSSISEKLFQYTKDLNVNSYYTNKIKNGVELKGYLSKIDFTLTGRMHFGISGMTYSKPMYGITYANKFEGMVKIFKINPIHCLVEYDKMSGSEQTTRLFIENLGRMKANIEDNLFSVKEECQKNYNKS